MNKPTPIQILKKTAKHFGLEECEMHQTRRGKWGVAWPRMLAMSIAYEQPYTAEKVGKAFNRDHTSVLYAHQRVEDLCKQEPDRKMDRDELRIAVLA